MRSWCQGRNRIRVTNWLIRQERTGMRTARETVTPANEVAEEISAAFIFLHELSREIIRKGSHLERRSTAGRVNGVQLDPIELIIGKDRDEFPGLEFGPAHP